MNKKLTYHNSFKFCTIFSFFESANDIRYLLILDNYIELPEISKDLENKLIEVSKEFNEKFNEYSNEVNKFFKETKSLTRIQFDQVFILNCLEILKYKFTTDINLEWIEDKLNEMDYKLIYSNESEFYNELLRLQKKAISKNNQIKKRKLKLENLSKKVKEENEESEYNYLDVVLKIERIANIKLDIYKDSILKYIQSTKIMVDIINKTNAQRQKAA